MSDPAPPTGLNTTFWEQPGLDIDKTEEESSIIVRYAGEWGDVKSYGDEFSFGDAYPDDGDYELANIHIERYEGPSGRLTLTYKKTAPDDGSGGGDEGDAKKIKVNWALTTSAQTLSILRYCGPSEGANAYRPRIEAWMNEQDGELKGEYKYHTLEGGIAELTSEKDLLLAAKILKGIESVQRHYPTIKKTTIYTRGKITPTGQLDHIGTPAGAPANMTGRAAAWLKIQEDIEVADDGKQTLVEAWLGGASFDQNLYGEAPHRWAEASI